MGCLGEIRTRVCIAPRRRTIVWASLYSSVLFDNYLLRNDAWVFLILFLHNFLPEFFYPPLSMKYYSATLEPCYFMKEIKIIVIQPSQ